MKVLFYQGSPLSERELLFAKFPGFVLLSFWYEQRVDKAPYDALVE